MSATIRPFELQLASPLATASGTIDAREGYLFDVTDEPGGLGEAGPLYPFTERRSDCHEALSTAAAAYERTGWRGALEAVSETESGQLRTPAARHAVSLAMLEWQSRQAGVPLYRHLGGTLGRARVAVNATIGDGSVDETVAAGTAAQDAGFETVKVKVGNQSVEADIERLAALRDAVGSEVELRVDANGAWLEGDARTFIEETRGLDLEYVEQPLGADDLTGHESIRDLGVDIAVDESLAISGVDAVLEADAADVFVVKPMAVGGVDVARGIVRTVRDRGFDAVLSTTIDSVVARTAAVHAAASLPDLRPSGLGTADFLAEDLATDPVPVQDGSMTIPDVPGLGIREVRL